jgi:hypothetical protein
MGLYYFKWRFNTIEFNSSSVLVSALGIGTTGIALFYIVGVD